MQEHVLHTLTRRSPTLSQQLAVTVEESCNRRLGAHFIPSTRFYAESVKRMHVYLTCFGLITNYTMEHSHMCVIIEYDTTREDFTGHNDLSLISLKPERGID